MSNKIKNIIITVLVLLFGTSLYFNFSKNKEIQTVLLQQKQSDSIINLYGKTIYTQATIVTQDKSTIKELTDSIFKLKKKHEKRIKSVIAYYSEQTTIRVDSFETAWVDTAKMKRFSDSLELHCQEIINYYKNNTVDIGRQSSVDSPYFKGNFTVTKTGITIDKIEFKDSLKLRFVEIKGGILKKNSEGKRKLFTKGWIEVQAFHENPYIKVNSQQSVIYQQKNKSYIYDNFIFAGLGVLTGLIL